MRACRKIRVTFGRRLMVAIKNAGMERKAFAFEMDVPVNSVHYWTSGKCIPNGYAVHKMAGKLGITMESLFEPATKPSP